MITFLSKIPGNLLNSLDEYRGDLLINAITSAIGYFIAVLKVIRNNEQLIEIVCQNIANISQPIKSHPMLSQVLEAPTDIIKKNTKHGLYAGIVLCITSRLAFFGYYKIKRELMNRKLIALDADAILQNEFQTLIRELKEETARLKKSTAHLINSNQKSNEIKQLLTTIDPDRVNQIERVYLCPILKEAMHDPVKTPDGFWFEREAIQKWYDSKSTNRQCIFNPKLTLQNPSELDTDISHQEEIIRVLRQLQKEQSTQSEQVLPRPHNL